MAPLFSPLVYDFDEDPRQRELLRQALTLLHQAYGSTNEPGGHLFMGDNLIVIQHQFGFLEDHRLLEAIDAFVAHSSHLRAEDGGRLRNRIWRFHTLCGLARNCLHLPGAFAEFGVYIGESAFILDRFLDLGAAGRAYHLFDAFDPQGLVAPEHVGPFHGPRLQAEVAALFAGAPHVRLMPGALPETLRAAGAPERFAFAHIDLNNAVTEREVADWVHARMVPGGVIVFDDYGWGGYGESRRLLDAHFAGIGRAITELPTGQGLLVRT